MPAEALGGAEPFIPICRELTLSGAAGSVFLDIFGVTPAGRPVLIYDPRPGIRLGRYDVTGVTADGGRPCLPTTPHSAHAPPHDGWD